ncbi:hypothetical protein AAH991_07525 [Microbispora sp. ZYX-F-249]|uniref:Uncharacterized protein n=1 Tax=Microbispora maris TaxID=3144104 RepID=A0ABV0AM50_9ACTN
MVPTGSTLSSTDPDVVPAAVAERSGLHLAELAFDALTGWH